MKSDGECSPICDEFKDLTWKPTFLNIAWSPFDHFVLSSAVLNAINVFAQAVGLGPLAILVMLLNKLVVIEEVGRV